MIKSTRHHLKDLNIHKSSKYLEFLNEYSRVCKIMVYQIWDELPENLNIPRYIDYKKFYCQTNLSARALSSAATQSVGIIKSCIEKQKRRLWVQKNINDRCKSIGFSNPALDFVAPILSSKCCDFEEANGKFYGFLRLKSLGKSYGQILLPIIRLPKQAGKLQGGFILKKDHIQLCWITNKEARPHAARLARLISLPTTRK